MNNQKIWIYTLSMELTNEQIVDLKNRCEAFVSTWTAHEVSLDASFELHKNRLLIFKVNEDKYNASGCSIDKQLRFVKDLEALFSLELLNRLLIAYQDNDGVRVVKSSQVSELIKSGEMNENTLIYDNTITSEHQLKNEWLKPLKNTWLLKYLNTQSA
jgi:hypothetical protein